MPKTSLGKSIACLLLAAISTAILHGQVMPPETVLPSDQFPADETGRAVAISGDTLVVGAPGEHTIFGPAPTVYVFVRQDSTWSKQAEIRRTDLTNWGQAVSISGDTFVAADSSNAYVYVRTAGVWTNQAVLQLFNDAGTKPAVSINGDTVAAFHSVDTLGAVGVFVRQGGSWTQQAWIVNSEATQRAFGAALALENDTLVIGAPLTNRAYVYVRNGATWVEQAELNNVGGQDSDLFGDSVALSHGTAILGARLRDTAAAGLLNGVALAFERNGTAWFYQATLEPDAGPSVPGQQFGFSVAIDGDTALVGTPHYITADANRRGSVWAFSRYFSTSLGQETWSGQEILATHTGFSRQEYFGYSVAIAGSIAAVGAPLYDSNGAPVGGRAYVYDGSSACTQFALCDPRVVWVDFNYTGTETGCSDHPYKTLTQGIAAVQTGTTLALKSGNTSARPSLTKPMRIQACGGAVSIGR